MMCGIRIAEGCNAVSLDPLLQMNDSSLEILKLFFMLHC